MSHFLAYAKAYCALIGAVLTAVLASGVTGLPSWVGIVAAVCTAVATSQVPNIPADAQMGDYSGAE